MSTNLMFSTKNPDLSKLKSTPPVNQKTPKAKFGTTNLSKILLVHQILRPYLYPQKQLPQIALYDQQGSYQSTIWPPKRKLQPLPLQEEEDQDPHQQHHLPPRHPPQPRTLSNKSKRPSTPPSVALEAEEEPLQEEEGEDQVHLDHQAAEELRRTLQYLLRKYQSQQQQMSAPWEQ